jgi:hypothetical protein
MVTVPCHSERLLHSTTATIARPDSTDQQDNSIRDRNQAPYQPTSTINGVQQQQLRILPAVFVGLDVRVAILYCGSRVGTMNNTWIS